MLNTALDLAVPGFELQTYCTHDTSGSHLAFESVLNDYVRKNLLFNLNLSFGNIANCLTVQSTSKMLITLS